MDDSAKLTGAELVLDENSPTVRSFVGLLEKRMLEGYSEAANRTWAIMELGCPPEKFDLITAIVLKQWKLAGTTQQVVQQRRDVVRQQYQYLYQQALEKGKLKEALHALDAQVKLDGLDVPPEGSLEDKIIGGVITNVAREQVGRLIQKAKDLAARGVPKAIDALPSPIDTPGEEPETNGHSNGHRVIDLRNK